ncbi:hypothetical protein A6V39_05275 [Candidatus Mycoplasma haematobovis]|uniref:Type I restriction enzyme endonuclease subunit n=2 Tax=Candidatus Mycoplasma haematobovis TaxID=432608 RepID=A0A1A9QCQ6_9MOLU|nr:hypothetical protein A6V39_05275 [Candidatus Mycoplasma haematobovis]
MNENTVATEYKEREKESGFMSEKEIEESLIKILREQGYEWIKINDERELKSNLRKQIEKLNNLQENHKDKEFKFTDKEWEVFFNEHISNKNKQLEDKTETIQNDHKKLLRREDRTVKNIYLIDKKNVHNNYLQVINQYSESRGNHNCRYDVTILVNGFPLVHIELKRNNTDIREAFRQINRYQENSFWAGSGLFEYAQIFIISNGKDTKYYSNSTRDARVEENNKREKRKSNASFEFTNYWASKDHTKIKRLDDFAKYFLNKKTILNILTKYCVFTTDKKLIVMRPYQIDAVEAVINTISKGINNKLNKKGGFIWHATGSGKTLTSFKAAQLASEIPEVEKVLFVVDRKALDHQTVKEYQKYGGDLTTDTANSSILLEKLEDANSKIIVTSIKKLSGICGKEKNLNIFNKQVVLIFDECHRSQFGLMHKYITEAFKKYYIFGFTGTPIFKENSIEPNRETTEIYFGKQLSSYTLVHAIGDGNVLKFQVSFFNVTGTGRINEIVDYVIKEFNKKTHKNQFQRGFNSIFAANSIEEAIQYYNTFKEKINKQSDLKIAAIFSPEEKHNESLEKIMQDYNKEFETDYDLTKFDSYRSNISKAVKERKIDLLIVADMFLTGFDAPTLNTLWLDKPSIRDHNLIQAFSRTNRIYNEIKSAGIIISFNDIKEQMDDALKLFGYEDSDREFIIDSNFEKQYATYKRSIEDLEKRFPLKKELNAEEKKEFIVAWNNIEPQINKLNSFDEFEGKEILTEEDKQEYRAKYLDFKEEFIKRRNSTNNEQEKNKLVEEEEIPFTAIEFIRQVEVDINYLLKLIEQGTELSIIHRLAKASPEHRDNWPLFEEFINIKRNTYNNEAWREFIEKKRLEEIKNLIIQYKLRNEDEIHRVIKEKNIEKINKGEWIEKVIEIMSFSDPNRFKKVEIVRFELTRIVLKYSKIS